MAVLPDMLELDHHRMQQQRRIATWQYVRHSPTLVCSKPLTCLCRIRRATLGLLFSNMHIKPTSQPIEHFIYIYLTECICNESGTQTLSSLNRTLWRALLSAGSHSPSELNSIILSRDRLAIDGVWIGNRICWTLKHHVNYTYRVLFFLLVGRYWVPRYLLVPGTAATLAYCTNPRW
jgi:hypothetical protein